METSIGWQEVALRLALTVVAGTVIGLNRGEHGRPAGLRTTLLVCLAASLSMIQVNLLLGEGGRGNDSFVMLDLMRLPLGILSGMGFIGAAAVLRRGDRILGVTTAATLWFVTIMGLCFGAGQLGLGGAALLLGFGTLQGLKWVEQHLRKEYRGYLSLVLAPEGPTAEEVARRAVEGGYRLLGWRRFSFGEGGRRMTCELSWPGREVDLKISEFCDILACLPGVKRVEWHP